MNDALLGIIGDRPATRTIALAILDAWPDHARYLEKSLSARTVSELQTTELLAQAALTLEGARLPELAANYRWTCDRLREEELFFHREGRYRLTTFAEADAEVYSNDAYMERYVDGLLLSQVMWYNHVASCTYYFTQAPGLIPSDAKMLEIGPGHGLMTYLAVRDFGLSAATVWDLSPVSVEHTRSALARLGIGSVNCAVRNALSVSETDDKFDFVVLSEVLEHIEDPAEVMRKLRAIVAPQGLVFVNVPINSPSPDHLYLMRTPDEARDLLRKTGFEIMSEAMFATQGMKLERALKNAVTVSVCMFARPV
ncbi:MULTISPECIES: class I SAM-dependent methyltransferase [Novosphingobium]|uniref:class I SAM-dependent methyltransferase n=1 Tax=Novosphingobium TaxID=165696 RepID=UPI000D6EA8F9|nr:MULTISPECIES: class I SAM-dependent methyltransferase [Novosphingobium]